MNTCSDCGTPLTTTELLYYGCSCEGCEVRRMMAFNEDCNENERDKLLVDSQFDGLTETVIVQVR